jgi:nitrogen permease regulator 2-like protein
MHISSVFFAVFDEEQGRKIVYQVPENLITTPPERTRVETPPSIVPHLPATTAVDQRAAGNDALPRGSITNGTGSSERIGSKSNNLSKSTASGVSNGNANSISPIRPTNSGPATTHTAALFEWQLVAQFVIPPEEMCDRLTISTTKKHRIVGFPVYIRDKKYEKGKHERGTFQFNVCFVFSKDMDYGKETGISCYEPVVRKLARILTACEVSKFASLICLIVASSESSILDRSITAFV